MIVLEGPDGAGKTRLALQLSGLLELPIGPKAASSTGGPVKNLRDWVDDDLAHWPMMPCQIRDRYPLISEAIYGPTMRHMLPQGFSGNWLRRQTSLFRRQAFVIFCMPPLPTVLANFDVEPQLDGVADALHGIYWGYDVMASQWPSHAYTYDYTRDNMFTMLAMAKQHRDRWYGA